LTDGANTHGQQPLDVAHQAADRQLRVYTIGFGTTQLTETVCIQEQLGSDLLNPGSINFGGRATDIARYILLDEPTLQEVADITSDAYFRAENADQLFEVFLNLPN
jgi:Ca-activated chloride channel family protein